MSIKKEVYHVNLIGHEINESLKNKLPQSDREIYCKKLHKITEPDDHDCRNCKYFAGTAMGHGIECKWKDVVDDPHIDEVIVPHKNRRTELVRVSKLIDRGILKKG